MAIRARTGGDMNLYKNIKIVKLKARMLALLLLTGIFFFSSFRQMCPSTLPFLNISMEEGQAMAKEHERVLFVFVCGLHCIPSHKMVNVSFHDTAVIRLYSNAFVCIKINPDQLGNNYKLTNRGLAETPSFLFYSPNKQLLYKTEGYKSNRTLINMAEIALRKVHKMKLMEQKVKTLDCDGTIRKNN